MSDDIEEERVERIDKTQGENHWVQSYAFLSLHLGEEEGEWEWEVVGTEDLTADLLAMFKLYLKESQNMDLHNYLWVHQALRVSPKLSMRHNSDYFLWDSKQTQLMNRWQINQNNKDKKMYCCIKN